MWGSLVLAASWRPSLRARGRFVMLAASESDELLQQQGELETTAQPRGHQGLRVEPAGCAGGAGCVGGGGEYGVVPAACEPGAARPPAWADASERESVLRTHVQFRTVAPGGASHVST